MPPSPATGGSPPTNAAQARPRPPPLFNVSSLREGAGRGSPPCIALHTSQAWRQGETVLPPADCRRDRHRCFVLQVSSNEAGWQAAIHTVSTRLPIAAAACGST